MCKYSRYLPRNTVKIKYETNQVYNDHNFMNSSRKTIRRLDYFYWLFLWSNDKYFLILILILQFLGNQWLTLPILLLGDTIFWEQVNLFLFIWLLCYINN